MNNVKKEKIKQFKNFCKKLTKKDKIAIIHHNDADGTTAAAIISKALQRLRGKKADLVLWKTYSDKETVEVIAPKIAKNKINKVICVDLTIDQNFIFRDAVEHIIDEMLILDHHKIYNDLSSDKIIFIKAQMISNKEPSKYPCSKLSFDLFSKLVDLDDVDWVACVGIVGDRGQDTWHKFINKTLKKYKMKFEDFQKMEQIISSIEAVDSSKLQDIYSELLTKKPKQAVKTKLVKYKNFLEDEIQKFYSQVCDKAEFYDELELIYYQIKSKYYIKSLLINRLSMELFPRETLIVVLDNGERKMHVSARRQDFKVEMNKILELATKNLSEAKGGGHIPAAAGTFLRADLDKFKEQLIKAVKKCNLERRKKKISNK